MSKVDNFVRTPTYSSWANMKTRCDNKTFFSYTEWGGRGISYDPRWKKFEAFIEDMGERPEGTTIDRIDNSLGYYKENCRWATPKEQSNNTRRNRYIEFNGVTKTLQQWEDELNIGRRTISERIKRGWSVERALTTHV
jgi:hypothetical protein